MKKTRSKKILFFLFSFLIFLSICLIIAIKIDDSKFLSDNIKYDSKYLFKVTYLIVDKDKTKKDVTISEANDNSFSTLNFLNEIIPLEKKGNYLYGDLKKFINSLSLSRISDYVFTMNNLNGEVIENCIFNKRDKTIKIPYSYYENKTQDVPVQMEIVSRVSKKEIQNVKFDVSIKNIFTNKVEVTQLGYDTQTSFTISNSKTVKLKKENLDIYVNNTKTKLKDTDYDFNARTGMISINSPVMIVNNVDIKINTSFLNKIALKKAHANDSTKTWEELAEGMNAIELEEAPLGLKKGAIITPDKNKVDITYGGLEAYDSTSAKYSYYYNVTDCGTGCVNGNKIETGHAAYSEINLKYLDVSTYTVDSKGVASGYKIDFPDFDILLLCSEHNKKINGSNKNVPVKLIALTDVIYDATKKKYYIVMAIETERDVYTQTMKAAFKLVWEEDSTCNLKVTKKFKEDSTKYVSTVNVALYSDNKCAGKPIKEVSIAVGKGKTSATKTIKNLEKGTYYIKETAYTRDFNDADLLEHDWKYISGCKKVVLDDSDESKNGQCLDTVTIENLKRKYCTKIRKVDAEDVYDENEEEKACRLKGIDFGLYNSKYNIIGSTVTTGDNGIAEFDNLDYGKYYYKETSTDGTVATSSCGGSFKYYNDNNDFIEISDNLVEMNYNKEDGIYECKAGAKIVEHPDHKMYYCLKVKKVDSTTGEIPTDEKGNILEAKFKVQQGDIEYEKTTTNGIATFMLGTTGGEYSVTEEEAPKGYARSSEELKVNAHLMKKGTTEEDSTDVAKCDIEDADAIEFSDSKLLLNWYKVTENGVRENGAKFKLKTSNNKYVTVKATKESQAAGGVTKNCYVYSGENDNGSELESYSTDGTASTNGEVCVIGISEGNYTAIETEPGSYHTFGSTNSKVLPATTTFTPMDETSNSNRFINYETYFEFTKTASKTELQSNDVVGTEYYNKTTEELKKIEFNIIDSSNNVLSFVETTKGNSTVYSYSGNTIDKPTGNTVTALYLDDLRKIRIEHLPKGTYSIKEKNTKTCDNSSSYTSCVGYYYPEYTNTSDYQFTITNCSNSDATSCGAHAKPATQTLNNEPTVIEFTKKDFYSYEDSADIVDFENDKERNDFDRIDFKIKDSNGNYLTLQEVGTHGTCLTDDSYREYRYVIGSEQVSGGTILHTCGGHIKITNLCRGNEYKVEEISVPEDSVFVKENTSSTPTEVSYRIPCKKGKITQTSNTKWIDDKGTRVRFEKRDSKYNYLIPDETTTFEVYRCAKGVECHPTDNKDENGKILESSDYKLIKFAERTVINDDREDQIDAEGLAGVEVYKAMSDSDVQSVKRYVTQLHPYKGILVLRYLQSGYNYVLVETVAPKNYTLPAGRNAETNFTVTNETVSVEEVDVPNKPTSILIKKYSSDGNLLTGAQFKIYEGTTCDANLSAMNQPKVELKLKTIRDGVYENRPNKDTSIITTCTDKENAKCSDIPVNEVTKLTYTDYLGTWTNFENTITEDGTKVELQEGEALIQYLEYGHCYIIEEIKAPKGYSLPKNNDDRFTMVTIEENDSYAHDTGKTLVNTPTPFTFYKFDEFNKLLDGAEFKLQKLDDNKKYHDVTVSKDEQKEGNYYKVDENTNNVVINTINGSATVYYLSSGQYRIVETKAAPGKELTKNPNIATFFVDDSGNVFGNSIIVNKGKTEKIQRVSSAKAELIVNIQTGQTVIKYGLIIAVLLAAITGLIILKKKTK